MIKYGATSPYCIIWHGGAFLYYYIQFNSITTATRIKNHFRYDGDYVGVMHTPSEISKSTCSYSVKVKPHKLYQIVDIAHEMGYLIKAIHRQDEKGIFTEESIWFI